MPRNFSKEVYFNKQSVYVTVVPIMRPDGLYYEVNIKGYPRFFMAWTELGRYDITEPDPDIPYQLILAVSDILEAEKKRR